MTGIIPSNTKISGFLIGVAISISSASDVISQPVVAIRSPSSELCTGDSLQLTASGTFDLLAWSTGETDETITIRNGGKYYVTAMSNGIHSADSIFIEELTLPIVTITCDPKNTINLGESVMLNAIGGMAYSWSPDESLDNPNVAAPIATPNTTTIFSVEVTGYNGCISYSEIQILVGVELDPQKVFSPNGDGIDDEWIINGIQNMPGCAVVIFDQQGKKVYEAKPYNNDWKARSFNGQELPDGTYYYIIKCDNEVAKTGSVLVLR